MKRSYGWREDGTFDSEAYGLACALVYFGRAVRDRSLCLHGPLDCGGSCCLPTGHDGEHHCEGDEDGKPGTCPA